LSAFERYYTELYRFLSRKLRDRHLAEDLTQETFSRALSSTQQVSSHRALLYHIAKNLLVDRYRDPQQRYSTEDASDPDSLLAPGSEQPESLIENQQYIASLISAIEALPPRCREAFILHRFDGLSQNEVAVRMGISTNMVEKHIIRAMLACRDCRQQWQAVAPTTDTEEARHG
jgi:RNA polymerase sigma factor (sigma-70 family)